MTNDQIHAPVNAFSAKYLLVILRISIFLNPPVTACQDQIYILFPQGLDIVLDQLFRLCAPLYLIDRDYSYFQVPFSAVGCRSLPPFVQTFLPTRI